MLLRVNDLHVRYGEITAVRGISLDVEEREIVCIVGPNGAGKSSTLLAIAGGLQQAEGVVELNGSSLLGRPPENLARLGISLVPEGRHVFGTLTVEENLRLGTKIRKDRGSIEQDIERIFGQFPILKERRKAPAGKLSGGEQQQLVIARALMTGPQIVLLDEPSLGLAPQMVDTVYDILWELREQGVTMLVVEQSVERAFDVADRIYVMRTGLIELSGTSEELEDHDDLHQAYFGFLAD